MHTALSDADARGSVRYVESEITPTTKAMITNDIAVHEGRQNITYSGGVQVYTLLVGGVAYLSGNQAGLIKYFGFPAAAARQVGSRWVSIPSSNSFYATLASRVTLRSAIAALAIPGHVSETAPTTVDGQQVIGIHGIVPLSGRFHATKVTATLYISRTSSPLPVGASYTYSTGGESTTTLSDWGETLSLTPPTNTIPESQLKL